MGEVISWYRKRIVLIICENCDHTTERGNTHCRVCKRRLRGQETHTDRLFYGDGTDSTNPGTE